MNLLLLLHSRQKKVGQGISLLARPNPKSTNLYPQFMNLWDATEKQGSGMHI